MVRQPSEPISAKKNRKRMEKRTANQQHRKIDKGGAPQKGTDQQNEQNLDELVEKTRLLKQLKEAGISVGHEEFGAWEQRMDALEGYSPCVELLSDDAGLLKVVSHNAGVKCMHDHLNNIHLKLNKLVLLC